MYQPIDIITESGVRIDTYADASIEINMGGMSLLNLSDRSATYTNSFSIPRTPTNEKEFQFASQNGRTNIPKIPVRISNGLFQQKAVLKVKSFKDDYQTSITYDSDLIIEKLKNQYLDVFDSFCNDTFLDTAYIHPAEFLSRIYGYSSYLDLDQSGYDKEQDGWYCFPVKTNTLSCQLNIDAYPYNAPSYNLFSSLQVLLRMGCAKLGLTIDGDLFSDAYFQKSFIQNNNYTLKFSGVNTYPEPSLSVMMVKSMDENIKNISLSDLIKVVAQIWFCDIEIDGVNIILNKIKNKISNEPVTIETLDFEKEFSSGYAAINRIAYKTKDPDKRLFGSDTFSADGDGEKDAIVINNVIPKTDSVGYVCDLENTNGEICIFIGNGVKTGGTGKVHINAPLYADDFWFESTVSYIDCNVLSMSGYYSDTLNQIFNEPIILNATGWIDPFTANNIIKKRVIFSIKFGGKFWVDTLAYNLTTGQSKLKLIKLT